MINHSVFVASCLLIASVVLIPVSAAKSTAESIGDSSAVWGNEFNTATQKQLYRLAMDGSAQAQYEIGLLFEYGRGVDQNDSAAAHWYRKSIEQQHPNAQYRLAVLLDNGWGLATDKVAAFHLYEAAAHAGHELAQHDLAQMYFLGSGTVKNLLQAYKWLKIAVLSGSPLMQKHLDRVTKEMTPDEIALANYLAQTWYGQTGI